MVANLYQVKYFKERRAGEREKREGEGLRKEQGREEREKEEGGGGGVRLDK